jgi:opacity protein-like surface antigen
MRKFLLIALCACSTVSFAQTGFFIQPQIGGGIANTNWQYFSPTQNRDQKNIFSDEFAIKAGYQNEKWSFTAGIGYLNTGYQMNSYSVFTPGVSQEYPLHAWPEPNIAGKYSMHDPHIILPLEVGYKIYLNPKLFFTPSIGAAAMYNLQRHIITNVPLSNYEEPLQDFKTYCNQYSLLGIMQFNFEYTLTHKAILLVGPSVQYMLTSEMKNSENSLYGSQYDYAFLINIGIKYCFSKKHTDTTAPSSDLKSAASQIN